MPYRYRTRDDLRKRIDELSAVLGIRCDPVDDDGCVEIIDGMIRDYESKLRSAPTLVIQEAIQAIDVLSRLSKDDWKVIRRLLALSMMGDALITRATDISTHRHTIRDEVSKKISQKLDGPTGVLVEENIVERSGLVYDPDRKRNVRYNWLSPMFFALLESIVRVRDWYLVYRETLMRLKMLKELRQRIEEYRRRFSRSSEEKRFLSMGRDRI